MQKIKSLLYRNALSIKSTMNSQRTQIDTVSDTPAKYSIRAKEIKKMGINPLISMNEMELRDLCRHHIDALEQWSRRFIDENFRSDYGDDYKDVEVQPGQPLIKSAIRRTIADRMKENPGRFPRWIDAIVLEDIVYFICREDLYKKYFQTVFSPFYSGQEELRAVLTRLTSIRNKLSHGNTISVHEAEQCLCYSNDYIGCLKDYYVKLGKGKDYNVPLFIRMKDSLGNDSFRKEMYWPWEIHCTGSHGDPKVVLRSGETYKVWMEVDGSFHESTYDISWTFECGKRKEQGKGNTVQITFGDNDVSFWFRINFTLVTMNTWHRCAGKSDDIVEISSFHDVLPPIESTY